MTKTKQRPDESELVLEITEIFRVSRNNYGTRKIKKKLMDTGKQVFRHGSDGLRQQKVYWQL